MLRFVLLSCFCIFWVNATLIVAHRGDSAAAPENTLPAFAMAFANGADAFETDLRTTSDGYIVCTYHLILPFNLNYILFHYFIYKRY